MKISYYGAIDLFAYNGNLKCGFLFSYYEFSSGNEKQI